MSISRVNSDMTFNNEQWLVSLLNTGAETGGHAMIVVEGNADDGQTFVGQYDVEEFSRKKVETVSENIQNAVGNTIGYINKIRVIEGKNYTYPKPYSELSSKTWTAQKVDVLNMIAHIKVMRQNIIDAKERGENSPYLYQKAGSGRVGVLGGNGGDNCVTWAENQIVLAKIQKNILENTLLTDTVKALPEAHVTSCHLF